MTGRKTLQEVREQLAAARAATLPVADTAKAQETLAALDRLADELDPSKDDCGAGEPSSQEAVGRTKRRRCTEVQQADQQVTTP